MKSKLIWGVILTLLIVFGLAWLKSTVPLFYAQAKLNAPAVEFVKDLQETEVIGPTECAVRYCYFETDYHVDVPDRIRISSKALSSKRVRVTLFDPNCRDDSTYSSIRRIYLDQNEDGIWIPSRHEWSQTGRGKFGWTTGPTS